MTMTATPDTRTLRTSLAGTIILAALLHAFDFGLAALLAGALILPVALWAVGWHDRTRSRASLAVAGLLLAWIVIGFGGVGGGWNHAVKLAAIALGGGRVPPALAPLFFSPEPGPEAEEVIGLLTFASALATGWRAVAWARQRRAGQSSSHESATLAGQVVPPQDAERA